jgi:hypothetical protein
MTLNNMRAKGVGFLSVMCHQGRQEAVLLVPAPHGMHKVGTIGADVSPNWRERARSPPPEPRQFGGGSPFALHPLESGNT